MRVSGDVRIDAPRPELWAALARMGGESRGIEGVERLETAGEDHLAAVVASGGRLTRLDIRLLNATNGGTQLAYEADLRDAAGAAEVDAEIRVFLAELARAVHRPGLPGWAWIGGLVLMVLATLLALMR
ncbi:hypothetical protein FJQ54_06010 [Sandaracinobacter neustonicus]|uniref:Carbon monoxide dehydrogenase subunit G n=1 Tax=Sandaracinobacter neustonicus TaxID=1715348 RepID=A0A501XP64_9SPHN|nr:hypothetical protein [Sandaracinobacter neustonicus]TPE62451.1 hypothetical protein FJQ54_06010 [Sandaracinobacter neustonicus]